MAPVAGSTVPLQPDMTVTVEWAGDDADGDDLLYSVLYSPDEGETWLTLSFEQTDTTFDVLVDTTAAVHTVRVVATDGARSAEDMVAFSLDFVNQPPVFDDPPTPLQGTTFDVEIGRSVAFQLQASDPDEGDLVAVNGVGLPTGATLVCDQPGNPTACELDWTPGPEDDGAHIVSFIADDGRGGSETLLVGIVVFHSCDSRPATIVGTAGSDQLTGTEGADVIVALEGNDEVRGLGGNDVICGGLGDDMLLGDEGADSRWCS